MYMFRAIKPFIETRIYLDSFRASDTIISSNQKVLEALFAKVYLESYYPGLLQILDRLRAEFVVKDGDFKTVGSEVVITLEPTMQKAIIIKIKAEICLGELDNLWLTVIRGDNASA